MSSTIEVPDQPMFALLMLSLFKNMVTCRLSKDKGDLETQSKRILQITTLDDEHDGGYTNNEATDVDLLNITDMESYRVESDSDLMKVSKMIVHSSHVIIDTSVIVLESFMLDSNARIVVGPMGSLRFDEDCRMYMSSNGTFTSMIDFADQQVESGEAESFVVSMNITKVAREIIDEEFGGNGKVLMRGSQFDCEEWLDVTSIQGTVDSGIIFSKGCRLAEDKKWELFFGIGSSSDKMNGTAAALTFIAIACLSGVLFYLEWMCGYRNHGTDHKSHTNGDVHEELLGNKAAADF